MPLRDPKKQGNNKDFMPIIQYLKITKNTKVPGLDILALVLGGVVSSVRDKVSRRCPVTNKTYRPDLLLKHIPRFL